MLDRQQLIEDQIRYWETRDLDTPYYLNGFRGEFDFGSHNTVPEIVQTLTLMQVPQERFRDVPLSTVNEIARRVHQGRPGFVHRAYQEILALQQQRDQANAPASGEYQPQLTLDDWNKDEGQPKELDT